MDRILEYSNVPSIEKLKRHNKKERYRYDQDKFSFANQIKTMKGDVKHLDRRMNEIARTNQNFYVESYHNAERNARRPTRPDALSSGKRSNKTIQLDDRRRSFKEFGSDLSEERPSRTVFEDEQRIDKGMKTTGYKMTRIGQHHQAVHALKADGLPGFNFGPGKRNNNWVSRNRTN